MSDMLKASSFPARQSNSDWIDTTVGAVVFVHIGSKVREYIQSHHNPDNSLALITTLVRVA